MKNNSNYNWKNSSRKINLGITRWRIESFRSIGEGEDAQEIELAPLTILCGDNSAGKSSFLKSILFMTQTVNNLAPRGKPKLEVGGPLVNIGSFFNALNNDTYGFDETLEISREDYENNALEDPTISFSCSFELTDKLMNLTEKNSGGFIDFKPSQIHLNYSFSDTPVYSEIPSVSASSDNFAELKNFRADFVTYNRYDLSLSGEPISKRYSDLYSDPNNSGPLITSPTDLAKYLNIDPKSLRAWLRENFTRPKEEAGKKWEITPNMFDAAVKKWGPGTPIEETYTVNTIQVRDILDRTTTPFPKGYEETGFENNSFRPAWNLSKEYQRNKYKNMNIHDFIYYLNDRENIVNMTGGYVFEKQKYSDIPITNYKNFGLKDIKKLDESEHSSIDLIGEIRGGMPTANVAFDSKERELNNIATRITNLLRNVLTENIRLEKDQEGIDQIINKNLGVDSSSYNLYDKESFMDFYREYGNDIREFIGPPQNPEKDSASRIEVDWKDFIQFLYEEMFYIQRFDLNIVDEMEHDFKYPENTEPDWEYYSFNFFEIIQENLHILNLYNKENFQRDLDAPDNYTKSEMYSDLKSILGNPNRLFEEIIEHLLLKYILINRQTTFQLSFLLKEMFEPKNTDDLYSFIYNLIQNSPLFEGEAVLITTEKNENGELENIEFSHEGDLHSQLLLIREQFKGIKYLGPLSELVIAQDEPPSFPTNAPFGPNGEFFFAYFHRFKDENITAPVPEISDEDLKKPANKRNVKFTVEQNIKLQDAMNMWLQFFDLADNFTTQKDTERGDIVAYVTPRNLNRSVQMTEIGVGFSQLAPIILLCLASKPGDTLLIEQPEEHIHPAGQQRFANLAIEFAKNDVQMIIETHSDHIVNRLRREVVESDQSLNRLFSLFFVERIDGKTKFTESEIDELGRFSSNKFPEGFFDQHVDDSMAILKARAKLEEKNKLEPE